MNFGVISDSIADYLAEPVACARCGSLSRVTPGLCVRCLMESSLTDDDGGGSLAALDAVLAEVEARDDSDWRLGNYQILEEIGRGGMGVIYRARQRHSRRIVAVKQVLGYHADSKETLSRFRREAEAAASLDHSNILPIYEVSETKDGLPFFSMKLAVGGSLLEAGPALRNEPRQCAALVAKIARAVQYAHSKGILHRDLKPGNILLDGHGEPLVSDFGLAKWIDTTSDLTRTLTVFGTPGYIAPEQAVQSATQLKPAADVYSLGAILFDLLTGRPPFLGSHALSVIRQASEMAAPKLRSLSKVADRDLETICARCLERDPAMRYQSAHDLAEDLERWLEGRPIIARPVSAPVRVWRWAKRNPRLAASMTASVLLGGLALVWQVQNVSARAIISEQRLVAHSVAVLPVLDLDTGQVDKAMTLDLANAIEVHLKSLGAARVVVASNDDKLIGPGGWPEDIRIVTQRYGVRAVLAGCVRNDEGCRELTIRLLDGESNPLYRKSILVRDLVLSLSADVERPAMDIYKILDAKSFSQLVRAEPDTKSSDVTSRNLILAGRALIDHRTPTDVERGIDCFEKAAAVAPESALAWASLAGAMGFKYHFFPSLGLLQQAESIGLKALALDPGAIDAHRALAGIYFHQGRFDKALRETFGVVAQEGPTEKAVALLGQIVKASGRPDKAINWFHLLSHGEARPANFLFIEGDCWVDLCDDLRARDIFDRVAQLRPDIPEGWMGRCRTYLLDRDFQEARTISSERLTHYKEFVSSREMTAQVEFFSKNFEVAEKLYERLAAEDSNGGGSFYGAVDYQSALARLRFIANDVEAGTRIAQRALSQELDRLQRGPNHPETLYRIAALESTLGNAESSIEHLQAAVSAGWVDYRSLALDPRFDGISTDPRFAETITALDATVQAMRTAATTMNQ